MRLWTLWRERGLALQQRIHVDGGMVKVGNPKKSNAAVQIPVRHPLSQWGEISTASIMSVGGKLLFTAEKYGDNDRACILITGQPSRAMTQDNRHHAIQDLPHGVTVIAKCTAKFDDCDDQYDEALIIMEPDSMLPIRSGLVDGILHCVKVPGIPTELFLWKSEDIEFFNAASGGHAGQV